MANRPKRPRDPSQLAKLILDIATGGRQNDSPKSPKEPAMEAEVAGRVWDLGELLA